MKVSVIIPAFNSEKYISKTIDSVLSQDVKGIEVIIVDDFSSDRTSEICKGYVDRVDYYQLPKNSGGSVARNYGAQRSKGEYLIFLDSDDEMFLNRVSKQLSKMQIFNADFSYCAALDEFGNQQGRYVQGVFSRSLLCGLNDIVSTSGLMITKSLYDRVSGFDEEFKRQQDIEFAIRLSEISEPIFIDEPLYLKKNSGSPKLANVIQGRNLLELKFKDLISSLEKSEYKVFRSLYYARLSELAFIERKGIFIKYFFLSLLYKPTVFFSRYKRYFNKFKLIFSYK